MAAWLAMVSTAAVLVAGEGGEALDDAQPGLGGQVFARSGGEGVQVAQEAWLEVAPEGTEGQLVAVGGGGQHRLEGGADHGAITLPGPAG